MNISLNNVRLRNKMLVMYFLSVFVPIILTNLVFYQITTNNVKKQKTRDISLTMEQIKNDFLAQINVAIGISSVLYTDNLLNESLEKEYANALEYVDSYYTNIGNTINKYSPVYKAIKRITIYTDNPTIVEGGGVLPITETIKQSDWFKKLSAAKGPVPIVVRSDSEMLSGQEEMFSVIRKMDYFPYLNHKQKILKVDIDMGAIRSIFNRATLQGNVYLLNGQNMIEYSTNSDIGWRFAQAVFSEAYIPEGALKFERNYQNINYLKNWKIIASISEKEVLNEVHESRNFVIYLAIPNIVIPTLIIIWITRSLNVRIIRILKQMKKVKNRHFEIIHHEQFSDEIGQLTEEFNRMTMQIKKLIDEVYLADIQKKDLEIKRNRAQLHALQSQIKPHFLFNALETIRMRSLMKHEAETAKIIQNMAKIFRKSLSWKKDFVSVREEMELVLCFLEIQKYRFGDKLDFTIRVAEAANERLIPNMTILPFVENASIHGIEPLKGKGRIELQIDFQGDALRCKVKDNGVGFSEEKLAEILHELRNEGKMGDRVGIMNVYYRLKLYYGDLFAFNIENGSDSGTVITILFPDDNFGYLEKHVF